VLTGDHIRAAADAGVVTLKKLHGLSAPKALDLAGRLVETLRAQQGASMRQVTEAFAGVTASPREVRLKEALVKLLLDQSELSDLPTADAAERRLAFFREAARARAAGTFDRAALLAAHGIESSVDAVERALYTDLPEHRILLKPTVLEATTLIADFDKAQARALLLSARSLTVFVPRGGSALRRLVWRAKFLGLIPAAVEHGEEVAVSLEGPASGFESSARYGLAFANFFPELEALPRYRLEAMVHLTRVSKGVFSWHGGSGDREDTPLPARESTAALVLGLAPHFDHVALADTILVGQSGQLIVPDITVSRGEERVHVELLESAGADVVKARLESWPVDARKLVVCWKEPAKTTSRGAHSAPWLFAYRRTLAPRLVAEHVSRFFG